MHFLFQRQTTYTPRLLLVDLDGSLKHLPREGELYGNSLKRDIHEKLFPTEGNDIAEEHESVKKLKEDVAWQPSDVEIVAEKETAKHEFQEDLDNAAAATENKKYDLADNVDSWADFLYGRYHPRTVHVVKQYRHDPEKQTFDTFCNGVQLWKTEQFEEDFCDRIRQYVEECDFMQGFQTLFDAFNGFGGMATQCMEHLNDEYGKANLAIPLYSPKNMLYENAGKQMNYACSLQGKLFILNANVYSVWRIIPEFPKTCFLIYLALDWLRSYTINQYLYSRIPKNLFPD